MDLPSFGQPKRTAVPRFCWACGYTLTGVAQVNSTETLEPDPGDYGICIDCHCWFIFTSTGTRKPTDDEWEEMTKDPDVIIAEAYKRRAIRGKGTSPDG